MKNTILILLVSLGLQTQAQINYCDSVSYTTLPQQTLTVMGDSSPLSNIADSIGWSWQACNSSVCYTGSGSLTTFPGILPTDTVKLCYDVYIYLMGSVYTCTSCDSLVYDGNSYSWVLFNVSTPTSIIDMKYNYVGDGKAYDLLGRELTHIPAGTIYIRNNRLYR